MGKKLTVDFVRDFINELTNGECELVSNEYINNTTPMDIRCRCGEIFCKDFAHIKRKRATKLQCEDCLKVELSEKYREDINNVIDYINLTGCEYIFGEYKNNNSILTIRCRCGEIFKKSFGKFKSGQDRCPDCGKKINSEARTKYTADYVQEIIYRERGYIIDKSQYQNSYTPTPCTCLKGHKFNLVFQWYLHGQSGCHECQVMEQQGENHPNWKGGLNEVIDSLRKSVKDWKMEVMAYYGFNCAITGEHEEDLVIHHLKAFSTILSEASQKLNIPVLRKIGDYENIDDFNALRDEVIKSHKVDNGIVLKRAIHDKFHDEYGRGNNTSEQFDEFLKKHYNTSLDQLQTDKKSDLYIPRVF